MLLSNMPNKSRKFYPEGYQGENEETIYSRDIDGRKIELQVRPEFYELVWDTEMDATEFADFMVGQYGPAKKATAEHFFFSEQQFFQGEFTLEEIRDNRFLEMGATDGTRRELQVPELTGVTLRDEGQEGVTWRRTDIEDYEIAAATEEWTPEYGRDLMMNEPTTDRRFEEAYEEIVNSSDL